MVALSLSLSLALALLATLLTVLTFRSAAGSHHLARDTHAADIRLRRIAGRVQLAEAIASGQRMKEDSGTAAAGVARLVGSVVRGVATHRR